MIMNHRLPMIACLVLPLCMTAQADNAQTTNAALSEVSVVSSAAGFEQNIADAPASITTITGEELNKNPTRVC